MYHVSSNVNRTARKGLVVVAAVVVALAPGCGEDQSVVTFRDNFVGGFSDGIKAIFGAVVDAGVATILDDTPLSTSDDGNAALNAP